MLELHESLEIHEKFKSLLAEGEQTEFTDQQLDDAEFYTFKTNPVSYATEVTLYNAAEEPLGTVSFEDADIAIAFIEELFELDPEDLEGLNSYSWLEDMADEFEQIQSDNQTVNNID